MSLAEIVIDDLRKPFMLTMDQGPGWSPDGGYFWVRGDFIYWADGEVGQISKGNFPCRQGFGDYSNVEDFSAWSDKKRASVLAETIRKRDEYKSAQNKYYTKRSELVAAARAKLTEEEFSAVWEAGRDNDDD